MTHRTLSPFDRLLIRFDQALRTVTGAHPPAARANPAGDIQDGELSEADRAHAAGLMRVNHAGEVSAQALYQGQSLTARQETVRERLQQSAGEENDHLAWCSARVRELGGRTSYLDPLWYLGSFAIGAAAGLVGDRWSLGFLAETERQVGRHLDGHLHSLPAADARSRAIIEQMKIDEAHHATVAIDAGAAELPQPVKRAMQAASKVMTGTAYYL